MTENTPYLRTTRVGGLRYLMTTKHHGGVMSAAQWANISHDEEFQVFDDGDAFEILDEGGNVYGVLRHGDNLRELGTGQQQVAKFPYQEINCEWHGYPIWPIDSTAPNKRGSEKDCKPSKAVFLRMENVGLITTRQRKRLMKGDPV